MLGRKNIRRNCKTRFTCWLKLSALAAEALVRKPDAPAGAALASAAARQGRLIALIFGPPGPLAQTTADRRREARDVIDENLSGDTLTLPEPDAGQMDRIFRDFFAQLEGD